MSVLDLIERLGRRLGWIREHRRIRRATRVALEQSESQRLDVLRTVNGLSRDRPVARPPEEKIRDIPAQPCDG